MIFKMLLIVSSGGFDLPCQEAYCPEYYKFDKICDAFCMIEPCNYDSSEQYGDKYEQFWFGDCRDWCVESCSTFKLGDGSCDEECNYPACSYDLGDCGYCAPGCFKEMLGDGICDSACMQPLCIWDGYDCGVCAANCFQEMLDNDVCDPECNSEECNSDNKHCGCADFCLDEELGSCKNSCLLPSCNYDCFCTDSAKRLSAYIFHLLSGEFTDFYDDETQCSWCSETDLSQTDCNNIDTQGCTQDLCLYQLNGCELKTNCEDNCEECSYDGSSFCIKCKDQKINQFGKCVDRCDAKEKVLELCLHSQCDSQTKYRFCYPDEEDNTSEDEPQLLIVRSIPIEDEYNAFTTLQDAYSYVWKKHTKITLMDDSYEIDKLEFDSNIISGRIYLAIESQRQSTFWLKSNTIQFTSSSLTEISLKNITIDGSLSINNDCQTDSCRYCPYIYRDINGYYNDRRIIIDDETEYNINTCSSISSESLFEGIIDMKFENCEFNEMRYKFESIISVKDKDISLKNVNFTNVGADEDIGSTVISAVCTKNPCRNTLNYEGGTIKHVNNGFEYHTDLIQYPFLKTDGMKKVKLKDLKVLESCLLCSDECFDFITIQRAFEVIVEDCILETNLFLGSFLRIDSRDLNLNYYFELDTDGTCSDCNTINIQVRNNQVSNVFTKEMLLTIEENEFVNSIEILENNFTNCVGSSDLIRIYNNIGNQENENSIDYDNSTYEFIRKLDIIDNEFKESYAPSLLKIFYKADLIIGNNTVDLAEDTKSSKDIVNEYMSREGTYISIDTNLDFNSTSVENLFDLNGNFNLELAALNIKNLKQGPSWNYMIKMDDTSGEIQVHSLEISDFAGPLLYLNGIDDPVLKMSNVTLRNAAEHSSIMIEIEKVPNILVFNLSLHNISNSKYRALHIEKGVNVTISECTFTDIAFEGTSGGSMYMVFDENYNSSLLIKKSTFTSCETYDEGGVLYLANTNPGESFMTLKIEESRFEDNNSDFSGAVLYISSSIDLHEDSLISSSYFLNNKGVHRGALVFQQVSGYVKVKDCYFYNNTANYESSAIYFTSKYQSELEIENTEFKGNEGENTIYTAGTSLTDFVILKNCLFENNKGSSIHLYKNELTDTSSKFISNSSDRDGACFVLENAAAAFFVDSEFSHNYASKGAVFLAAGNSYISAIGAIFKNNIAAENGGVMFLEQNSYFHIENSEIYGNHAEYSSVIALYTSKSMRSTVKNSKIYENVSTEQSILINLSNIIFENVEIKNNVAEDIPGLYSSSSDVIIKDCSFANQSSQGTDFIESFGSDLTIDNSTFTNENESVYVVSVENSSITITISRFENLKTRKRGAIFGRESSITIIDSVFSNTSGSENAGALHVTDGSLTLDNCYIQQANPLAIYANSLNLTVTDTSITQSEGGIICSSCIHLDIYTSKFTNLGKAIEIETASQENNRFNIANSHFQGNLAESGAAISTNHQNILIEGCLFDSNYAQETNSTGGEGGAVQLISSLSHSWPIIKNSRFVNNTAEVKGGAISWSGNHPVFENLFFESNHAHYGPNISSFAVYLTLLNENNSNQRVLTEGQSALKSVPPGQVIESFSIAMVDHYDQLVRSENKKVIIATSGQEASVSGTFEALVKDGIAEFDSLIILGNPGQTFNISMVSDLEDELSLVVEFRNCTPGEVNTQDKCIPCEEGTYSLDPSDTKCKVCPGSSVCYGMNNIVPKAGFWRSSNESDVFWECPISSSCEGGLRDENDDISYIGRCATGHTGNMCQSCKSGYTHNTEKRCTKCPELGWNIMWICLYVTSMCVVIAIMVRSTFISAQQEKELHSVYIKIFVNYFQLATLVTSFNLNWPELLLDFFSVFQTVENASDVIFSEDCLLGEDAYFLKLIMTSLTPIVLGLVALFFWAIVSILKKRGHFMKNELIGTLVILLFLVHPFITAEILNSMNCVEIDKGEDWLRDNLDIPCWDDEHRFYLLFVSLPALLLWVFILPLLCFFYLYNKYDKLDQLRYRKEFGFLYNGYNHSTFYWEFVIILRKVFVVASIVLIRDESNLLTGLVCLLIVLISVSIHARFQPYKNLRLNQSEFWGIIVSVTTLYAGLLYLTEELNEFTKLALFVLIILVNAWFIQYLFRNLLMVGIEFVFSRPWVKKILRKKHYTVTSDDLFHIDNEIDMRRTIQKPENMRHLFLQVIQEFNKK